MLSTRAYSFRHKSRLAISLSWIAGYTNVIAVLVMGTFVSHMTGTATQLGRWLGTGDFREASFFAFLLLAFTMGAALSAYLTEGAIRRGWRSKYVLPIGLEAMLLAFFMLHLNAHGHDMTRRAYFEAAGIASLAMGLQNATITRISGAVVRTTHLTGIFTDFGLEGVQYLFWWGDQLAKRRQERAGRLLKVSRRHPTMLRLLLLLSIAGSFGFGTVVGTLAFGRWGPVSLLGPIAFLMWIIFVDLRTPIADIRELDLLNDPELRLQGILSKLLPHEVVLYRATCHRVGSSHRAPDFQTWLDRVPEHCRVVVLAITPQTRFTANAVMDLEAAVSRLREERRTLILSGITTRQFKALDALGVAGLMDVNNICPDLEFAIARAIGVLEELRASAASHEVAA